MLIVHKETAKWEQNRKNTMTQKKNKLIDLREQHRNSIEMMWSLTGTRTGRQNTIEDIAANFGRTLRNRPRTDPTGSQSIRDNWIDSDRLKLDQLGSPMPDQSKRMYPVVWGRIVRIDIHRPDIPETLQNTPFLQHHSLQRHTRRMRLVDTAQKAQTAHTQMREVQPSPIQHLVDHSHHDHLDHRDAVP